MTVDQAFAFALAFLSQGWASLGAAFPVLVVLMLFDIVTGIQAAFATKELSSSVSWRGMNKKIMTITVCALASVIAYTFSIPMLPNAVAAAYSIVELLSISENLHRGGVWVPPILQGALLQAQKTLSNQTVTITTPDDSTNKTTITTTSSSPQAAAPVPIPIIINPPAKGGPTPPPVDGILHRRRHDDPRH